MSTKKTTTPSAKKTFVKEIKDSIDFSSLYTNYNHEKGLSSENFLSLIRKSSSAKNEEISKYISSNETIKELFSNSQLLTEIIYGRAEKILSSALGSDKKFPIPVRKVAQHCGFEIVEVDFQAMTDEFTWTELQKNLGKSAIARMQMREKLFDDEAGTVAGTIYVQKDLDENSKRFAIAHELGHFVLRTVNPIGLLYIEEACPGLYDFVQEREFLANTFAYALLLPYHLTYDEKKAYQRKSINLPIDYSSWIIHLRDLSQLPEYHVVLAYEKVKLLHMSHMRHLQQEMKDALEFYANLAVPSASSEEFWGKYNAHVTFNALFYDKTTSEKERASENKTIDPSIFDDEKQLFQWAKMLQYACWYFASQKSVTTYRICRKVDADELLAKKQTISFTSTSYKILSERADIRDPVLLVFHIPPRTPCVDLLAALGKDYSEKNEEQEVTLPPFLSLRVRISHATIFENLEKLIDSTLPSRLVDIYEIDVGEPISESNAPGNRESSNYLNDNNLEAGRRVLTAISKGVDAVESDVDAYLLWKEGFRRKVWEFSQEAWNEIVDR
jgi:hypothetical protein